MKHNLKFVITSLAFLLTTFISNNVVFAETNQQASSTKKHAGYFFAYNDTDKTVVLTVGNYFPTAYTIDPNSYRMIWVTTDNQNIHIKDVFP